jgi:hypothetical protein
MIPSVLRTIVAGLAGGLAFVLGTSLTFALLGGSRRGQTGPLFDPATQSPKVIAVWKEIEPLPRVIESPLIILGGFVLFAIAFAFVYRSVAPAWPKGVMNRGWRLAIVLWIGTIFSEFIGPFNVLHQPLSLSVIAWAFWAVCALFEGYTIAFVAEKWGLVASTSSTQSEQLQASPELWASVSATSLKN